MTKGKQKTDTKSNKRDRKSNSKETDTDSPWTGHKFRSNDNE